MSTSVAQGEQSQPGREARASTPGREARASTPGRLRTGPRPDLDDPEFYLNRELSWLEFNRRVLAQATDGGVPLLERLRFLSIFSSNLDEFFMVRVAGLKQQLAADVRRRTADGRTPGEQLEAISQRLRPMLAAVSACLHEQLLPLLARHGISLVSLHDVGGAERERLDAYFEAEVFPVLTPLAVDPGHPFPYLSNMSLSLAVTVRYARGGERRFARVKVPVEVLSRFVRVDGRNVYVPLEELIGANLGRLFPGMIVEEFYPFRVTRNADLEIEEDEADDLLLAIEQELRKRRFGAVVRLEAGSSMPRNVLSLLADELAITSADTYCVDGLLGLADLSELADLAVPSLRWSPWHPVPHPRLRADGPAIESRDVDPFAVLRRGDLLVHHPYDSFAETVQRFIEAAAHDPSVLAIKQTLYRTSGDSPIVRALIGAAERGKQVVALVELKARFDEEANIVWARELERAGVHVVYGLVGLKTHSKTTLVVRREPEGLRRYVHIGTGNYNSKTALLYTDLGLFSCDASIGADVTDLFNVLTGYSRQNAYRRLLVSPVRLRERIVELIQREIDAQQSDRPGLIRVKLNSLTDQRLIAELYRASQAGVQVDLVVRGICSLRPLVPGVSDRIRVVSIVGRLLEHARILQFGPDDIYIGSADWMPRNLDRRIEVVTPVQEPDLREELRSILDLQLSDNTRAWDLAADGSWTRRTPDDEVPRNSQELLMERSASRLRA